MQTITQKKRFLFIGTIHELHYYLRTLPRDLTLQNFILQQLH